MNNVFEEPDPVKPLKRVYLDIRWYLIPKNVEMGVMEIEAIKNNYSELVCGKYFEIYGKYPSLKPRKNYDKFPLYPNIDIKVPLLGSFDEQILFLEKFLDNLYDYYVDNFKDFIKNREEKWEFLLKAVVKSNDPKNDLKSIGILLHIVRSNTYDNKGRLIESVIPTLKIK